jgi:putative Mn2+ efflux pump MntP
MKQSAASQVVTWIRRVTLACAFLGCLLSFVWPVIDLTALRHTIDEMPDWLGIMLLLICGCYCFWEIRLSLQVQDPRDPKVGKRLSDDK